MAQPEWQEQAWRSAPPGWDAGDPGFSLTSGSGKQPPWPRGPEGLKGCAALTRKRETPMEVGRGA